MRFSPVVRQLAFVGLLAGAAATSFLATRTVQSEDRTSDPVELSQDPATWTRNGEVDPALVPERVAISTDLTDGWGYLDPSGFYPMLGARLDQEPVPVFDARDDGRVVGYFHILQGTITQDRSEPGTTVGTVLAEDESK